MLLVSRKLSFIQWPPPETQGQNGYWLPPMRISPKYPASPSPQYANKTQSGRPILVIYAPMIYTAPRVVYLMRADTLRGQVGGGWALEIEILLGPVTQKTRDKHKNSRKPAPALLYTDRQRVS